MVKTCIVKGCENKENVHSAVIFHRVPTHHIQRRAWLAALNKNPKTPLLTIKKWRVCSDHFTKEDYTSTGRLLKEEATPSIFRTLTQERGSSPNPAELSDVQEDLPEQEENFFVGVLQSTPQKHRAEEPTAAFKVPLSVQLTSPLRSGKPAVALAPTWTVQSETHHIEGTVMDISATSLFDVSMISEPAVDTADTSFVPNSSPSTTTTGSSSSIYGQARGWKERKWVVNESKLMELFQKCTTCGAAMCELNHTVTHRGSRININWQCNNGHLGQWESCPNIRGMAENNLFAAAATLFTGSTYTDIADWAGLFNLQLPLESTYYSIQASYLLPVIEKSYTKQENIVKARLICQSEDGDGVHLSGDGRSDSPGHSSKYNTYSFMDDSTNQIVGFELMQVSQASSSVAMEPLAFKKALEKILDEGIDVKVVTTDRHPSIRKIMREEYPSIIHQFDPWHVAKGFKKKMVAASNRKEYKDLSPWVRSVSNHMWWSCCTSKGDAQELLRRWMSLQHHITGIHRWEENGMEYRCFHQELSAEEQRTKRWLKGNSPAFKALQTMITDTRLIKDLQQMTLFKHTGQLEVFHNALLKYCPKRLHFQYPSMKARTMLAIMDHNENHSTKREQATTASGLTRHNVVFQKQSKQWIARPIYVKTTQNFRDDLMDRVIQRRLDPTIRFKDPSSRIQVPRLAANIALQTKPSKEEVIQSHTSRFKGPSEPL
ncbi:uncharacterized protein LOC130106453 [Rhinichthys klamathensis goyatoka]|uniref:uncharacterized protein LOC130106453 n=1 Tax=Rhinichthys klamathensis goyatoka TaxID=3034132 RepID=UPI0024B5BD0F|nr:uncharacterized protein LOC130106453 [Rhinichthys klamathensis goyatoka]